MMYQNCDSDQSYTIVVTSVYPWSSEWHQTWSKDDPPPTDATNAAKYNFNDRAAASNIRRIQHALERALQSPIRLSGGVPHGEGSRLCFDVPLHTASYFFQKAVRSFNGEAKRHSHGVTSIEGRLYRRYRREPALF